MADNLPPLRDHFLVQYILGKLVNQVLNLELVEVNSVDQMEDYPFVTFNWIDPGHETTADWLDEHRQYVCTMQIDVHATDKLSAMNLSQRLYRALHEAPYRRFFSQAHILPDAIGNAGNRTVLQGINYDHDFGFDCSFIVNSGYEFKEKDLSFTYEDLTIESVKAEESVTGSNLDGAINVHKNEEEI